MQPPQQILSIQSWVAFGHVGNAAAVFPLQRLGFEVAAIHTVQFSNHTGYGAWTGSVFEPSSITDLVRGIAERGALMGFHAVLSGYMGTAGTVDAVLDAVTRVRELNPDALYCCDPVMGDIGRGVFVRPEIPEAIQSRAVKAADILTPNQFELELLTGKTVKTLPDALEAVAMLRAGMRAGGPQIVLLTSLVREDAPANTIETLAVTHDGAFLVSTPFLQLEPPRNGTGDAIAALFLGHYLKMGSAQIALENSVSALFKLLEVTDQLGTREIQMIAVQDEFVSPSKRFLALKVG
jgi:pyridoxine kinase